jgi:hypothetical protein
MRGPASTSVLLLCLTLFGRGVPQECGETCSAERVAETKRHHHRRARLRNLGFAAQGSTTMTTANRSARGALEAPS